MEMQLGYFYLHFCVLTIAISFTCFSLVRSTYAREMNPFVHICTNAELLYVQTYFSKMARFNLKCYVLSWLNMLNIFCTHTHLEIPMHALPDEFFCHLLSLNIRQFSHFMLFRNIDPRISRLKCLVGCFCFS